MKAHTKEVIQYGTAVAMIASAIVLAFVSFYITCTIGAGVLTYVGEAFGSGLAIFGIASYFKHDVAEFKAELKREYEDELRRTREQKS